MEIQFQPLSNGPIRLVFDTRGRLASVEMLDPTRPRTISSQIKPGATSISDVAMDPRLFIRPARAHSAGGFGSFKTTIENHYRFDYHKGPSVDPGTASCILFGEVSPIPDRPLQHSNHPVEKPPR